MNWNKFIFAVFMFSACGWLMHSFTQKHYIKIVDERELDFASDFHPEGFFVVVDQETQGRLMQYHRDSRELAKMNWDFNRYSYVVSYGKRMKALYWSDKATMIDDESPEYCRVWKSGKKLLRPEYADSLTNTAIIYTIPKDTLISGMQGV